MRESPMPHTLDFWMARLLRFEEDVAAMQRRLAAINTGAICTPDNPNFHEWREPVVGPDGSTRRTCAGCGLTYIVEE